MNVARPVAAVAVAAAIAAGTSSRVSAADPSQCMSYSPLGFCIEWSTPGTDNPGSPGSSGGGEGPPCYWVTIDYDPSIDDGPIFVDYGIEPPPEGVEVVWQVMECSDGSAIDDFRWIIPPNPREIAEGVRGRVAGTLPEPLVASSPAEGVAAIVGVPVFVQVTNWTGVVTAQECAGFCVTVRAVPSLTFNPGEAGASAVACAEAGTAYMPDGPPPTDQAAVEGACSYTYGLRTGVPDRPAAWPGSVTVTWTITWTATTGASGALSPVTRSADLPRSVEELQTVVQGGELP